MGTLVITYTEPGQRPLAVAIVDDPQLLKRVARAALDKAESNAVNAMARNRLTGELQMAEVERLRTALGLLVPGLFDEPVN